MENSGTVSGGDEKSIPRAERVKTWAAWILLSLPLAVHPLFWVRMFRPRVVAWDCVTLFSLSAMAFVAAAVLMLTGFSDLRRRCAASNLNLLLTLFSAALMIQSLVRSLCFGRRLEPVEWFLPLLPLAGMALSRQIMRILPRWGTLVLAVLIVFTLRFPEYCIGLPGNWNWNLALLTVLIPAPFLLRKLNSKRFWIPVLTAAVFLTAFSLLKPQLTPRGVIVGAIVASAALWLLWKLPRRQRLFITILGGAAGIAMSLSVWMGPADSANRSSRFWLWRGSVELAMKNGLFGCGAGRFEREIGPCLPNEYYFSDFATNLHTHPHNELLSAWCDYGLLGVGFVLLLSLAVVSGLRNYSATRVWGFWLFMVLALHGQFDVVLQTPLAGTLWLVVGGALAGWRTRPGGELHPKIGAVGALAAFAMTAVMFMASWYYREALLSYGAGDRYIAGKQLEKSLALWELPEARYRLGQIEYFDLKSPKQAIGHFKKLSPGYLHSNLYIALAYADMGNFKEAAKYLDAESRNFPLSALNAYIKMAVMHESGEDEAALSLQRERFYYLLRLRGVSEEELLKDHSLDDRPLRNP